MCCRSATDLTMASKVKTLEQHPPKIRLSIAPTASHCGMVSIKMRPSMPMILEDQGRWSSMPWISAFSSEGAALITRGVMGAEAAACCWAFWREEGCRRRVGRVVIYTGFRSRTYRQAGGRTDGRSATGGRSGWECGADTRFVSKDGGKGETKHPWGRQLRSIRGCGRDMRCGFANDGFALWRLLDSQGSSVCIL